jgi:phytoene synthase
MMGEIRLQWWRETLESARSGRPRDHALARGLSELFTAHPLPPDLFDAILDARAFDATPDLFASWSEVENYCDQTSGNLMRLAAHILGGDNAQDDLAREAGTAYAIAGLIRSLQFHAARHKVYLPQDLLGAVGLLPDQIMAGKFDAKVKAAIAQTVLKADEHYRGSPVCSKCRAICSPPFSLRRLCRYTCAEPSAAASTRSDTPATSRSTENSWPCCGPQCAEDSNHSAAVREVCSQDFRSCMARCA